MKTKKIGYWVATGILGLGFVGGGLADLFRAPDIVAEMEGLGFPLYVMSILGVWKVLAAGAVLAPGLQRLKEWAYAGIVFDLTGAASSHVFAGSAADKIIIPLVFLAIAITSWRLRPADRTLGDLGAKPVDLRSGSSVADAARA